MTPGATSRRQENGQCAAFCGGHPVVVSLFFAVMVAALAFIAGGQDAFRWRERAAQTSNLFGQQVQSLPARDHQRAVVAQDRKDPPQTGFGDPAAISSSLAFALADYPLLSARLPEPEGTAVGRPPQAFMPRGPPPALA